MTTPDVVSAVVAERPGPLTDVLRLHTATPVDDPLGEGEVLVRMLASTVNPSDAVTVSGAYGSRTVFPFVPGFEGVGVIERIGPGVPRAATGRRVLPLGTAALMLLLGPQRRPLKGTGRRSNAPTAPGALPFPTISTTRPRVSPTSIHSPRCAWFSATAPGSQNTCS